jgi:2-desacetyl-2-hydroxyethyl bacteriochlorophyllide A dehydrogenase
VPRSRYVLFPEPGRVEIAIEDAPEPGPGEILCRAEASLISTGTELHCLRGEFDPGTNWADWIRFPFRPGYGMAARVVAAGPGVSGLEPGGLVASWTPHREYFVLETAAASVVPDGVSAEEAAFMALGSTTQLAVRRAALQLGERVGVIGLGLLGQLVVQYCRLAGARTVIAIDAPGARLDAAVGHGADALAGNAADVQAEIEAVTGGHMLDVVFDVTGHPDVLAPAIGMVRQLGRVVLLGDTPTPTRQRLGPGVVSNSVAILGIHARARPETADDFHPWSRGEIAALFLEYVADGRMRVADLVTDRVSPDAAPEVYAGLAGDRSRSIGVIFDWNR